MFKRLSLALLSALLLTGPALAQTGADLNISPKRIVFDPGERSATVYIFNQGDREATYTIELVDRVMLPDGQIVAAADRPGTTVASAGDLIQYTPRRVTLQPRQSQSIRVRARPSGDGTGERRAHLTVTALPSEDAGFTVEQAVKPGSNEVAVQVVALFSVSIPVILREGQVDARAAIENLTVKAVDGVDTLSLDLVRLGANSVYGDIEVRIGKGPNQTLLTAVRGVAVYPEIGRRAVTIRLPAQLSPGDSLTILYRDDDARPGDTLATATLVTP